MGIDTYNPDNERVTSYQPSHIAGTTVSPITYLKGMWEENNSTKSVSGVVTTTHSSRLLYQFGGLVIAERSLNSVNGEPLPTL